jgi:8-oxo-dGTP diphosphatase
MPPILTIDVVLMTLVDNRLHVALFKREAEPFKGALALPGGFVHEQEDLDARGAAARVLQSKVGVVSPYLEEFGTRSGPARDPRGWSLTVVYYALLPASHLPATLELFPVDRLPRLAFDHNEIVQGVAERVRSKASYSSLPVFLCEPEFTVPELHAVYEAVLGERQHLSGFRRKLEDLAVLEPVPGATKIIGRNRPAQLYRVARPFLDKLSVRQRGL